MKNRITTLIINWQDWDIYEKKKMKNYGLCKPDKQEILIRSKGLKVNNVNDTILHELLHAIIAEYEIDHRKMKEEELVSKLSKAIIAVLNQILPWIDLYSELRK